MEREVYTPIGLPKQKSLSYNDSIAYYSEKIAPSMSNKPIPIIIDNGSFEVRAVFF